MFDKQAPIQEAFNTLLQRIVEHGFMTFYRRMGAFYQQLATVSLSKNEREQIQSTAITMDNIWIYVRIFGVANGLAFVVFVCEFVTFYRKSIQNALKLMWKSFFDEICAIWRAVRESPREIVRAGQRQLNKIIFYRQNV